MLALKDRKPGAVAAPLLMKRRRGRPSKLSIMAAAAAAAAAKLVPRGRGRPPGRKNNPRPPPKSPPLAGPATPWEGGEGRNHGDVASGAAESKKARREEVNVDGGRVQDVAAVSSDVAQF